MAAAPCLVRPFFCPSGKAPESLLRCNAVFLRSDKKNHSHFTFNTTPMPNRLFIGLLFVSTLASIVLAQPPAPVHPPFGYELDRPDIALDLPAEVREVSGLGIVGDSLLAAVNDEAGIVFLVSVKTGKIVQRVLFRETGDYEGVEVVGKDAWVIKSNGTLYQIKDFAQQNPVVEKYKSFLNSDNDVEGLAFDPARQRLLIGCKGKGQDRAGVPLNKAIYAFDLATKTVVDSPAYLLTLPDLNDFIVNSGEFDAAEKLERIITAERTEIKFSPSGIAIHPKTGEVYVTSARGNTLLVLDANGKILHLERLKKSTHAQPEGICFDSEGTLFIANEGGADGSPGKVFGFLPK
jgi:DNA-binding beta-propeller fold protein YncE